MCSHLFRWHQQNAHFAQETGLRWSPPITPLSLSVASRQYNPQTKVWYFSIDDHDLLLRKSRGLAPGLIVTPLPTWVSDAFRRPICTHQH